MWVTRQLCFVFTAHSSVMSLHNNMVKGNTFSCNNIHPDLYIKSMFGWTSGQFHDFTCPWFLVILMYSLSYILQNNQNAFFMNGNSHNALETKQHSPHWLLFWFLSVSVCNGWNSPLKILSWWSDGNSSSIQSPDDQRCTAHNVNVNSTPTMAPR